MRGLVLVVNRYRTPAQPEDFDVSYGSRLGNPYRSRDRGDNLRRYKRWLKRKYVSDAAVREIIQIFADLVRVGETVKLACACAPEPCHADIIRKFVLSLARRKR